jgi:G:T-mismatch repair DNA endonuclease (very short patch repair protein)
MTKQTIRYSTENMRSLCVKYNVSYKTLKKKLVGVPGLVLEPYKTTFYPKQVELIYLHLGSPNE